LFSDVKTEKQTQSQTVLTNRYSTERLNTFNVKTNVIIGQQ